MRVRRDEGGAVAIIVAVMLVVLMGAIALSLDVGSLYLRRRALVTGADAAALSAARTCARGGFDDRFASSEEAADAGALANAPITAAEVSGANITDITDCGTQWGHVSVGYTSLQSLAFAPVLGFHRESPVSTAATASWGLGSNNPIPIVLTSLLHADERCPLPPTGRPATGDTCAFWYDNDRLNGGNFAFLSLNPQGWDVPSNSNCSGSGSGGSSNLRDWIMGTLPASVALNWKNPTYVCTETGIRGVQNASLSCGNPNNPSSVWSALQCLADDHAIRDFPINWEGPGRPVPDAPLQGTIWTGSPGNSTVDKYDIIGFASMEVVDVVTPNEAAGTTTTTDETWDPANYTYDPSGITLTGTLPAGAKVDYTWTGVNARGRPVSGACSFTTSQAKLPSTYTWQGFGGTGSQCPGNGVSLNVGQPNPLAITIPVTTTVYGPCGPPPPGNDSAMCVILQWQRSTLDEDFPPGTDNNTVVRLCDLTYGTCLDQRRGL